MALTTRILPYSEWARLAATELKHLATLPGNAPGVVVVVVEEEDGLGPLEIVGCWAAIQTTHVEGLWHKPEVRGRADVGRALLQGMIALLQNAGVAEVVTNALDPKVKAMLGKMGGRPVPGELWVFPVPPKVKAQCARCGSDKVQRDKEQDHPGVGICEVCGPCYIDDVPV